MFSKNFSRYGRVLYLNHWLILLFNFQLFIRSCVCVWVCPHKSRFLWSSEEVWFSATGVTDNCEPPDFGISPLWEQHALLGNETSIHPSLAVIKHKITCSFFFYYFFPIFTSLSIMCSYISYDTSFSFKWFKLLSKYTIRRWPSYRPFYIA